MSGSIAPRPGAPTRTVGGYGLVCEITRGVLGTLWVAKNQEGKKPDSVLVRRVSVRPGDKRTLDALIGAAEWGRKGVDPRLSPVLDVATEADEVLCVTPFVDGEPLRALLRAAAFKRESFDADVALRVVVEVLEQLQAVHERTKYDPMHRAFGGLQPDSILVGTDGLVRLLDVGLAVQATDSRMFTEESQWVAYVSPEQLRGKEATAASDVFAAGAILWELLANRRLFAGATAESVRERIKSGKVQRLDELRGVGTEAVKGPIVDVVAKALEQAPAARYQSVVELSDAVRAAGKLATRGAVAAAVERLASQFLEKRRVVFEKSGIGAEAQDGRTDFVERPAETAAHTPSPAAPVAGAMSTLASSGSVGGHATPPPPPSVRGSLTPPPPPSVRAGDSARSARPSPSSRTDRALALAKAAAAVARAPAPPARSEPPPSPEAVAGSPVVAMLGAPQAPAQPAAPAQAATVGPSTSSPAAAGSTPATAEPPAATAPGDTSPAASPGDATVQPAPSMPSGSAQSPAASAGEAAPSAVAPAPVAGLPAGGASVDLDDNPFAKPKSSKKGLWIGIGAVALVVILLIALSGGPDEASEPAVAEPPAKAADVPAPKRAPEPTPAEEAAKEAAAKEAAAKEAAAKEAAAKEEAAKEEAAKEEAAKEEAAKEEAAKRSKSTVRPVSAQRPRSTPRPAPTPTAVEKPSSGSGAAFKPGGI